MKKARAWGNPVGRLGHAIVRERLRRGMTQVQFAREAGSGSRFQIGSFEQNKPGTVDIGVLQSVVKYLNCSALVRPDGEIDIIGLPPVDANTSDEERVKMTLSRMWWRYYNMEEEDEELYQLLLIAEDVRARSGITNEVTETNHAIAV